MPSPDDYDLGLAMGRIEEKLDAVLSGHKDHGKRLNSLERSRWTMAGAASVIATICTAGWAYLTKGN
jgi:hypothetical protein